MVSNSSPARQQILQKFQNCTDLTHRTFPEIGVDLFYFGHMVGSIELARDVIEPLSNVTADEVPALFQRSQFKKAEQIQQAVKGILDGNAVVCHRNEAYIVFVYMPDYRNIESSETESVITGPHDAFVEISAMNLSLLRRRVKSSNLKVLCISVGEISKTDVYIIYLAGITHMDSVNEMKRRIENIKVDSILDSNMLVQYIDDHPNSIFPQFQTTERPDAAAARLSAGKVLVIVDGSPSVISGPSNFFEFFSSPDDYYHRWAIGTATRVLRFIALVITMAFTAFYVSITTFHYEMVPEALLLTLVESRSRVPFPPLIEALLMEVTIELLREAGARLPSKIGQTIGIVGGIVIGQAAVQAGITSNVLIIAVSASAISSFVIPMYVMSASIRLIRFGLIILAGTLGNFGIIIGICAVVIHLSGLTSLRSSYLFPIAPIRFRDWKDSIIRAPFSMLKNRPSQTKSPDRKKQK